MDGCLILFAKEPRIGFVKTRLARAIGDENSVKLYKAFIKDTVSFCGEIECGKRLLAYESENNDTAFLSGAAAGFVQIQQSGRDLGERLNNAFKYSNLIGCGRAVIIGTDSPVLPPSFIREAFSKLDDVDLALGPSRDGGFYLIGARGPCLELFRGIEWSTEKVLEQTKKNADSLGLTSVFLSPWYDVDSYEDLILLERSLRQDKTQKAVHTKKVLQDLTPLM